MSCDCIHRVLKLSESEKKALDEYVDDSVPPVSNIMDRWRNALKKKAGFHLKLFQTIPFARRTGAMSRLFGAFFMTASQ
jgi:hypothetical protein